MWFVGDCYFYKFLRSENTICTYFIFIIERLSGNLSKYSNYATHEKQYLYHILATNILKIIFRSKQYHYFNKIHLENAFIII